MTPEKNNEEREPVGESPREEAAAGGLEDRLVEEQKKSEDLLARLQRSQADFINYKRRIEQERQDFSRTANAELIRTILPVVDDLERALENVPEDLESHEWVEGVRLVERKFKTCLEGLGVKPVLALGMEFDPNYHEALHQDAGPEGVVIGEFQKGYTLHEKLLRPARVIVGNGEESTENKEEE